MAEIDQTYVPATIDYYDLLTLFAGGEVRLPTVGVVLTPSQEIHRVRHRVATKMRRTSQISK